MMGYPSIKMSCIFESVKSHVYVWLTLQRSHIYMYLHVQSVGAGTRLSQYHDMQFHKKIYSSTDITICTVLN